MAPKDLACEAGGRLPCTEPAFRIAGKILLPTGSRPNGDRAGPLFRMMPAVIRIRIAPAYFTRTTRKGMGRARRSSRTGSLEICSTSSIPSTTRPKAA
jgi:hypothetical protein